MLIALFIVLVLTSGLAVLYLHDRRQTTHTILRNFPIIGYFRYFAETLGEYMRQYQYLPDWSERPFNRLERSSRKKSAPGWASKSASPRVWAPAVPRIVP